ncbi:hypothetical protein V8E36_005828 [Tilletia maclaganii]
MLANVMRKDKATTPSARRVEASPNKTVKSPGRKHSFSSAAIGRKEKVNVVSKASLAMLNPRLAMGMESSDVFDSPDTRGSREWTAVLANLKNANKPVWNDADSTASKQWTASPTPELEAFTMEEIMSANLAASSIQPPAEPWVAKQFTDELQPSDLDAAEPEPQQVRTRERKLSSKSSNSTLSRLFSWKKGVKGGRPAWNEDDVPVPDLPQSYSAVDLVVPHSAPPTVTTFDLSGGPLQTSHSDSWAATMTSYAESASLPCSPVRDMSMNDLIPLPHLQSPAGSTSLRSTRVKSSYRLSRMQSLPSIRISDIIKTESDEAPALPSLDKLRLTASTTSPVLPSSPAWESTFGKSLEDCGTPTQRPTSRFVSSTGRGVPSFSPNRFRDGFSPQLGSSTFGTLSTTTTTKEVRRRSRSLGAMNAPPPRLSRFGSPPTVFSPASPSMGAFLPDMLNITPDLSELSAFAAQHGFASPTSPVRESVVVSTRLSRAPAASQRRPILERGNSISTDSSSGRSSFEDAAAAVVVMNDGQTRREDLTQRARAVAVASPSLSQVGRSPLNPSQSAFVVTVMPPTPDLSAEATPRMGESGDMGGGFDQTPAWVADNSEIVIEGPTSPRRAPRSTSTASSPRARIKARRDTVVIDSTYAMPQYRDMDSLNTHITPKMSYDYFDASALQQEQEGSARAPTGKQPFTGLRRRERRTSELSDFTEISECSSSGSNGGPFGLAHSLSQSSLAHSASSSTLGSDSPKSASMQKFELISPSASPTATDSVVRQYRFTQRTPLDFQLSLPPSSSMALSSIPSSSSTLVVQDDDDEGDDVGGSELGYMSGDRVTSTGTLENDESFKADATFAGLYVSSNRRISMLVSNESLDDAPGSAQLDVGPPSLPRSKSANLALQQQRDGAGGWENLGFTHPFIRSASVGDLTADARLETSGLPHRSMSSDNGLPPARAILQAGPRPGFVSEAQSFGAHSTSFASRPYDEDAISPASTTPPSKHPFDEQSHLLSLKSGHGFGIDEPFLHARSSNESQRPVLVVPGGLNRVRSSKAAPASATALDAAEEQLSYNLGFYRPSLGHALPQPGYEFPAVGGTVHQPLQEHRQHYSPAHSNGYGMQEHSPHHYSHHQQQQHHTEGYHGLGMAM